MGIGALVLVSLSAVVDFVGKVNNYSKTEDTIKGISSSYNDVRSSLDVTRSMAQQAIGISQDTRRQVQDQQSRIEALEKERSSTMQYIDKRIAEYKNYTTGTSVCP
jgi:phage shock protein A